MKKVFNIGDKFKHYNGYVWEIKSISGKIINLESEDKGNKLLGSMSVRDLQNLIKANYYQPL